MASRTTRPVSIRVRHFFCWSHALVEHAARARGPVFDHDVMLAERLPLPGRIARAENRDARNSNHRREMRRTGIVADESRALRQHRRRAEHAQPPGKIVRSRPPRRAELIAQRPLTRSTDRQQHDVPELPKQRIADGGKTFRRPRRRRAARAGRDADQQLIAVRRQGRPACRAPIRKVGIRHGEPEMTERLAARVRIDDAQQTKPFVLDVRGLDRRRRPGRLPAA